LKHRYKPHFHREDILTASGLLNALKQLFPNLTDFPDEDLIADIVAGEAGHHAVLRGFRCSFREEHADDVQLASLARLIGLSLSVQDNIENAWMTCFIEAGMDQRLEQHLSNRDKLHIRTH